MIESINQQRPMWSDPRTMKLNLETPGNSRKINQPATTEFDLKSIQFFDGKLSENSGKAIRGESLTGRDNASLSLNLGTDDARASLKSTFGATDLNYSAMHAQRATNAINHILDQNSDGTIEKAELQAFIDKMSKVANIDVSVDDLFSQFDSDQDGVLSSEEAKNAFESIRDAIASSKTGREESLSAREIRMVDQNSDGSIDKTELQAFADKINERTGQTINVDDLFSQFDSDEDGVLSSEEAKTAFKSVHRSLRSAKLDIEASLLNTNIADSDQNSDGSIDKTELQAFADKINERMGQTVIVDDLFSQFDSDQDGVLSSEEAKNAFKSVYNLPRPENLLGLEGKPNYTMAQNNIQPIDILA